MEKSDSRPEKIGFEGLHEMSVGKAPSPLLLRALPYVANHGKALDLGASALRDSRLLLQEGFEVTAVDKQPQTRDAVAELQDHKIHAEICAFEDFVFPVHEYDIVNANNSLSFVNPEDFSRVWKGIVDSIKTGGVLSVNFFGTNDGWARFSYMSIFTKEKLEQMLSSDFEILEFFERERDAENVTKEFVKHWHTLYVIARKIV